MLVQENIKLLLNVVAEDASGEGPLVSTGSKGPNKSRSGDTFTTSPYCRFTINCTAHTGTSMAIDIVAEVGGVDVLVGSFTPLTDVGSETILIESCPVNVKVVYTETSMTDWDCSVFSVRF
jgi:hypothetical protein